MYCLTACVVTIVPFVPLVRCRGGLALLEPFDGRETEGLASLGIVIPRSYECRRTGACIRKAVRSTKAR